MAHVVKFETFRTLKACRTIQDSNRQILSDLSQMRTDTARTLAALEEAEQKLEDTLACYAAVQKRLGHTSEQHRRVMRVVDHIMDTSPAFDGLR